jgi:hypothetical protein
LVEYIHDDTVLPFPLKEVAKVWLNIDLRNMRGRRSGGREIGKMGLNKQLLDYLENTKLTDSS